MGLNVVGYLAELGANTRRAPARNACFAVENRPVMTSRISQKSISSRKAVTVSAEALESDQRDKSEPSNRGVKLASLGHIFERLLMFRIAKTSWVETNVVTSTKGDC